MKTRILTAAVGLVLLAAVMVFYDTIFFNLVFALVCIVAIHEVYTAFQFGRRSLHIFIGFSIMAVIVMLSDNKSVAMAMRPAFYIFTVFVAICVIIDFDTVNFAKLAGMTVFSAVIVYCFYSFIYLKTLLPMGVYGYDAAYFVVLILAYAWGGDTCAYFFGRAFGKRKLAPVISPKKTWEGALGGVLGSMVLGLAVSLVYVQLFGRLFTAERVQNFYYLAVALMGIGAAVLGIIGDLFASAVKRQNGIKDYGTIFPGHGGILDRFDSVLFIAPLVTLAVTALFYRLRI